MANSYQIPGKYINHNETVGANDPNAHHEKFTSGDHAGINHEGLPGILSPNQHAQLDHSNVPGVPSQSDIETIVDNRVPTAVNAVPDKPINWHEFPDLNNENFRRFVLVDSQGNHYFDSVASVDDGNGNTTGTKFEKFLGVSRIKGLSTIIQEADVFEEYIIVRDKMMYIPNNHIGVSNTALATNFFIYGISTYTEGRSTSGATFIGLIATRLRGRVPFTILNSSDTNINISNTTTILKNITENSSVAYIMFYPLIILLNATFSAGNHNGISNITYTPGMLSIYSPSIQNKLTSILKVRQGISGTPAEVTYWYKNIGASATNTDTITLDVTAKTHSPLYLDLYVEP